MVIIKINEKKIAREFQNMACALAFAYQNGECHCAEKLEIAYTSKKAETKPAALTNHREKPEAAPKGKETGTDGEAA